MKKLLRYTAFCGCMLVQLALVAQSYTFTGTGNWNTSARWACIGVGCTANNIPPQPIVNGSSVTISGTCTLNVSRTISSGASLTVSPMASLIVNAGRTLRNNGTVTNGGTITNSGTIVQNATFINNQTLTNNGALNLMVGPYQIVVELH